MDIGGGGDGDRDVVALRAILRCLDYDVLRLVAHLVGRLALRCVRLNSLLSLYRVVILRRTLTLVLHHKVLRDRVRQCREVPLQSTITRCKHMPAHCALPKVIVPLSYFSSLDVLTIYKKSFYENVNSKEI